MSKLLLPVLLLITALTFAQHGPNRGKIKSLKIAFITEHLNLSSDEAQAFWPVYNDYQEKREALRQKERTEVREKIREANELSEKDARSLLEKYIRFEEEEEALENAFLKNVSKVISAKKTLLLLRSEEEFKRRLIRQYRHNKGSGGHR